jgi:hypothetical protein
VRSANAGTVVTFNDPGTLYPAWCEILSDLSRAPQTNWRAFEKFTAREMTRRQCEFFDRVLSLQNQ